MQLDPQMKAILDQAAAAHAFFGMSGFKIRHHSNLPGKVRKTMRDISTNSCGVMPALVAGMDIAMLRKILASRGI